MANTWPKERRLIGKEIQRLDGADKATGTAKYSFDINRPSMLHARILRSPHAHATVKALDTSAAEKLPGVKAVHVIAGVGKELFYAGDEIVALAADTEEHAADAVQPNILRIGDDVAAVQRHKGHVVDFRDGHMLRIT